MVQEIVGREARGLDDLIADNAMKSDLSGMQFVLGLPNAQAEFLKDEIEHIRSMIESEKDNA